MENRVEKLCHVRENITVTSHAWTDNASKQKVTSYALMAPSDQSHDLATLVLRSRT